MAEIRLKRKTTPWWLLLLLALVTAGLLWFLLSRLNNDGDQLTDTQAASAGLRATQPVLPVTVPPAGSAAGAPAASAAGEPITSLQPLLAASDPGALSGRPVRLENVPVPEMVGDATFWIGEGAGRRVLVVLDQKIPSPPAYVEGRVNVNAGQRVRVDGIVRRADDPPPGDVLDAGDRAALASQPVYVWASSAQVVSPAEFAPAGPPGRVPQ
ncbi:MAG: hypothetical protein KY449_08420 [Proteobacteria bacterium]|nr:hypothetical protein [Pseudomonadota bacterium]